MLSSSKKKVKEGKKKNFYSTLLHLVKYVKDDDEILIIHQDYEHPNEEVLDLIYDYEIEIWIDRNEFIAYVDRVKVNGWIVLEIKSSNSET